MSVMALAFLDVLIIDLPPFSAQNTIARRCFNHFYGHFYDIMIGPAGPQGPLRGPYPGSSPPGQQMRGPIMANNAGPRPPYMGGPNQGPLRGPAGKIKSHRNCIHKKYSCLTFNIK